MQSAELSSPEYQKQVNSDLARRSAAGGFVYLGFLGALWATTDYYSSHPVLLAAISGVSAACAAGRFLLGHNFNQIYTWSATVWRAAYFVVINLNILFWGLFLTATFLRFGYGDWKTLLLLICLAGTAPMALAAHTPDPVVLRTFLMVLTAPMIVGNLYVGGPRGYTMALVFSWYLLFALVNARILHRQYTEYTLEKFRLAAAKRSAENASNAKSASLAKMSHELRETEERFRIMADTAPVMIWMSGTDALLTFFNKTWLEFTGRTREQELGSGWAEGVHPEDLDRCFAQYSSSYEARRSFHIEYRLRRADGEYRWMLCRGVPRFELGGDFAGYIGSDMDITDLKRAQEEAFEKQKLESLSVLTGGIAHDFNNLLGSILADAELALSELPAGTSSVEEIQRIKSVAIRASEIVRELMIYSGQETADLEPVDVSRLVGEMLELLRVTISKHAVLKTDLRKDLPAVKANASQIRRVVMNLIINASEAIGEQDGVIHVATSRVMAGQDLATNSVANLPEGDYLRLEVSDTGCGMAKEASANIFDPFFTTKFAGRGLGLAVVQGIVRAHGGAINLVSEPGQGTTIQIVLPCSVKPAELDRAVIVPDASEPTPAAGGTVLLVEDEATLRLALAKMLRTKGFSVVEADDGTVAIDVLRDHPDRIDVILLDMTIPGSSSQEVMNEVRQRRSDTKVILTSAYSREMVTRAFDTPQIRAFIRKPFLSGDLVRLLQDTLLTGRGEAI